MTLITLDASKGQLVALDFPRTADGMVMPFDFQILALTTSVADGASAGSAEFVVTFDGTEIPAATLPLDTGTDHFVRIPRGRARGRAGTRMSVRFSHDELWESSDPLSITVWALFDLEGV